MSQAGRRVRRAVNPLSTAATRWWCEWGVRRVLTGYGPAARQRRLIRHAMVGGTGPVPPAETMKERAAAIDQLLGRDGHR